MERRTVCEDPSIAKWWRMLLETDEKTKPAKDPDATVCNICYEVRDDLLVMSKTCGHWACAHCIGMTIRHRSFSGGAFQIPCPFGDGVIDWPVVEQCATKKELTWLVTNMVNHAFLDRGENQYWCPLCETGFISDNLHKCPEFQCPNCKKRVCYQCHVELKGETPHDCDKSESSGLGILALGTKVVECPGCLAPTVRVSGCNHMECPCGVHYCWLCGDIITGRAKKHYTEECSFRGQQCPPPPRPPPPPPGSEGLTVGARLRLEFEEEERSRNRKRIGLYILLLLTGPIAMTVAAIGVTLYLIGVWYAAWYEALLPEAKDTLHDKGRKVGWMLVTLFLITIPISLLAASAGFVILLLSMLVILYIAIPVEACYHGGLSDVLDLWTDERM